jgi:ribonuclease HI
MINIYTDGACSGNPGKGGWGVYIENNSKVKELNGYEDMTTNNRMELTAVIKSLEDFKDAEEINIFTDSKYVMDGINLWMNNWKKNNWITVKKKPVKNKDLWEKLDTLCSYHRLEWTWIKGHSGNPGNEKADYLATSAIEENN